MTKEAQTKAPTNPTKEGSPNMTKEAPKKAPITLEEAQDHNTIEALLARIAILEEAQKEAPKPKAPKAPKTNPKTKEAPKAPKGFVFTSIDLGGLVVGSIVHNLGGSAKNGSVPTIDANEKVMDLTKASPGHNGQEYKKVHLVNTKTKTKRTKFLSTKKMVMVKEAPKPKAPKTKEAPKTNPKPNPTKEGSPS